MSKEFTQAISQKLDTLYPSYTIYVDNVEEGFTEPCFFIQRINKVFTKKLDRRNESNLYYDVMVFKDIHTEQINFDFQDIEEKLLEEFELITVQSSKYRTFDKETRIVDDVLHLTFRIPYTQFVTATEGQTIEEIQLNTELEE